MIMAEDIEYFELDFMGTFRTTEFVGSGIHENFKVAAKSEAAADAGFKVKEYLFVQVKLSEDSHVFITRGR